ncbi:uncharacterized protein SETTUDRAFT_24520 [Exserohilum turcica Et28A]|uniref:Uncharacterized protein n=1 Tax=Exserohilum turcicum (strain 28A) TaxID=671987 RepID=R0JI07_EXST2|nr:uncharacterized protein SETTUDRAFT_24520 [Exserohilum turcica Et28A]EOA81008.1 hypothetical protein SETTUDRAFT_24520 [Exserohilum turcica Et28A]
MGACDHTVARIRVYTAAAAARDLDLGLLLLHYFYYYDAYRHGSMGGQFGMTAPLRQDSTDVTAGPIGSFATHDYYGQLLPYVPLAARASTNGFGCADMRQFELRSSTSPRFLCPRSALGSAATLAVYGRFDP